MRSLALALSLGFLVPAVAIAAPPVKPVRIVNDPLKVEITNAAPPGACARFQLVGFTSATLPGDAGVLGFTAACEAEFPASRMCSSVEVMESAHVPASLAGDAWVRPVFAVISGVNDASGTPANNPGALNCGAWTVTHTSGLRVFANGGFDTGGCDEPRSVGCCAPAE